MNVEVSMTTPQPKTHNTIRNPPQSSPLHRLVLEFRVKLGCVEVRDESGGQHRHQDKREGVQSTVSRENGFAALSKASEESSAFYVTAGEGEKRGG